MEVPYLGQHRAMRHKGAGREIKFTGPRVMSALQVWLWLLLFIFQNSFHLSIAAEPGYLDFDNLPDTNFSCAGKVIGGYYADLETDCQMFHVCTIGQLEEPMDIKFLCLNGTVFDQETRVCERVDEVDCSRSEHFYSLNLELYGNTAPPIIKEADPPKSAESNEDEGGDEEEYEDVYDEPSTTTKATPTTVTTTTTTTAKPKEKITSTFHTTTKPTYYHTTVQSSYSFHDPTGEGDDEAYELIDDNEDSSPPNKNSSSPNFHYNSDSQLQRPSSNPDGQKHEFPDFGLTIIGGSDDKSTDIDSNAHVYNPHELIYQHNNLGRKTPAVSFQQQSYSSDGQNSHVTVTTHTGGGTFKPSAPKSPNKLNDNVQLTRTYLSSSTPNSEAKFKEKSPSYNYPAFEPPKRTPLLPTPVAHGQIPTGHPGIPTPKHSHHDEPLYIRFGKPALTPQGFKPSHINSNINLNAKPNVKNPAKPFQSYQPSERHEVSIESEFEFEKLTPTFPYIHQDFSQIHYERKRSQDSEKYVQSETPDKIVETTTVTSTPYYNTWATRNNNYTKSLPRVIVTASASVSDSNGKKLNYTVGNIVRAVKPLVPTNYDEYKESDVLLDPFFLDVPKLQKPRGRRSSVFRNIKSFSRIKRRNIISRNPRIYVPMFRYVTSVKPSTDLDIPIKIEEAVTQSTQNSYIKKQILNNQNSNLPITTTPQLFTYFPKTVSETTITYPVPPDYVNDNYEPLTYSESSSIKDNQDYLPENKHNIEKISVQEQSELVISKSSIPKAISESAPKMSFRATLIDKNKPYLSELHLHDNAKTFKVTTESNIAKTTLDVANLETTTVSFVESVINKNVSSKEVNNYQIKSVHLLTISNDKSTNNLNFSCNGKKYFKFYPDKTDCRTFHICSPGLNPRQVLDIVFVCDLGTYFDHGSVRCIPDKPNDCELFSVL